MSKYENKNSGFNGFVIFNANATRRHESVLLLRSYVWFSNHFRLTMTVPPSAPSLVEAGGAPNAPLTKRTKFRKVVFDLDPETPESDALEVAVT